jgi:hypothetical protein
LFLLLVVLSCIMFFEAVFHFHKNLGCLPFSKRLLFLLLMVFGCIILFCVVFYLKKN